MTTPGVNELADVATDERLGAVRRRFVNEHDGLPDGARAALRRLVADEFPLLGSAAVTEIVDRLHADLVGLGPVELVLRDPTVTDVLINGPGPIWVERNGVLEATAHRVLGEQITALIERAFGPLGISVDRAHPIADGRLPDGSRVSVVLPPLCLHGPVVAVRRFGRDPLPIDAFGPDHLAVVLRSLVERRANIVVYGSTGSGKTTLVGSLARIIDPTERVVVIEDAAEVVLSLPHLVRLETRVANGEGAGAVELRELVRAALRLRPDRLIVGEVRGAEALDMIWALSTGHRGSLSTCHARGPLDALARLETFVLMSGVDLPLTAARQQVRRAVDALIGVERCGDGTRRVVDVSLVSSSPDHPTGIVACWPTPEHRGEGFAS
ncbi:MAG: CpaF family protein [Actinobacteria bacterium]|nr:CpaF family protein [Actinomycetota bacterium]